MVIASSNYLSLNCTKQQYCLLLENIEEMDFNEMFSIDTWNKLKACLCSQAVHDNSVRSNFQFLMNASNVQYYNSKNMFGLHGSTLNFTRNSQNDNSAPYSSHINTQSMSSIAAAYTVEFSQQFYIHISFKSEHQFYPCGTTIARPCR